MLQIKMLQAGRPEDLRKELARAAIKTQSFQVFELGKIRDGLYNRYFQIQLLQVFQVQDFLRDGVERIVADVQLLQLSQFGYSQGKLRQFVAAGTEYAANLELFQVLQFANDFREGVEAFSGKQFPQVFQLAEFPWHRIDPIAVYV